MLELRRIHDLELGFHYERQPKLRRYFGVQPKQPRSGVTTSRRFAVLERDNFRCVYCGAAAQDSRLVIDHRIPVAAGGSDEPDNLATACVDCNAGKAAKLVLVPA